MKHLLSWLFIVWLPSCVSARIRETYKSDLAQTENAAKAQTYVRCTSPKPPPGYAGCIDLYQDANLKDAPSTSQFYARLSLRYTKADKDKMALVCQAYPAQCDTPEHIENLWAYAHGLGVEAEARANAQQAKNIYNSEMDQNSLQIQRGLSALGEGLQGKPQVNCTSTTFGNQVQTKCQ